MGYLHSEEESVVARKLLDRSVNQVTAHAENVKGNWLPNTTSQTGVFATSGPYHQPGHFPKLNSRSLQAVSNVLPLLQDLKLNQMSETQSEEELLYC